MPFFACVVALLALSKSFPRLTSVQLFVLYVTRTKNSLKTTPTTQVKSNFYPLSDIREGIPGNFWLECAAWFSIPCVREAFHARFPVSVKSQKVTCSCFTARVFGLRPTKLLVAREKRPLVSRVKFVRYRIKAALVCKGTKTRY